MDWETYMRLMGLYYGYNGGGGGYGYGAGQARGSDFSGWNPGSMGGGYGSYRPPRQIPDYMEFEMPEWSHPPWGIGNVRGARPDMSGPIGPGGSYGEQFYPSNQPGVARGGNYYQ